MVCSALKNRSNIGLEPSCPLARAIMSPRHAAQAARWADEATIGRPFGGKANRQRRIGVTIMIEMPAANSRDRMIEALRELPPDATVDDAIERLVFLAKIDAGLAELDRGEGVPHDEVKRRFGL